MIRDLLPDSIASFETGREWLETDLFPDEVAGLGRAVETRRREFVAGRACARLALRRLGLEPTSIGVGGRGQPLWPVGVVGSITHCARYRAAAVARAAEIASVGIDAEVHEPLPLGVLDSISSPRERQRLVLAGGGAHLDRVFFSAKEAVYKAWFPLTERWLGFEDVDLSLNDGDGSFCARLLVEGPVHGRRRLGEFRGRWEVDGDVILTAVVVEAEH